MTLRELKSVIDRFLEDHPMCSHEHVVTVLLSEPSIGASAQVRVKSACVGFDWDSGRFMLSTEEPIIRKPKRVKPSPAGTPRARRASND